MKYLSVLLCFISLNVFSANIYNPDDAKYYTTDERGFSLYLDYIQMPSVYNEFSPVVDSTAKVAIFDAGCYIGHEDLSLTKALPLTRNNNHGTRVSSVIASKIGNFKGSRGL